MSVTVKYNTGPTRQLLANAEKIGLVTSREILDAAGAVVLNKIKQRFLRQEAPDGSTWPESKAAAHRRATNKGGGTLFASGDLFHSIELRTDSPLKRAIFTDIPYALKHQEGRDGELERVFLGFSDNDIALTRGIIQKKVKETLHA